MRVQTLASAVLLGLSGAALAQVAASNDPKLGNAPAANGASAPGNAANAVADPSDNTADPGKH